MLLKSESAAGIETKRGGAPLVPRFASMKDPEQVQEDDHEDRHTRQPEHDIAQHVYLR